MLRAVWLAWIHLAWSADYFPPPDAQGGWRVRPAGGMDSAKLDEAFEFAKTSTQHGGLLVVRHGYLVYERYFGLGHRDANVNTASCGKAFTSIAMGILMKERPDVFPDGLEQKVFTPRYLPPEAFPLSDPRKSEIKLGHLLAMTSGIRGNNPSFQHGRPVTLEPAGPDGVNAVRDRTAFDTGLWCNPGDGYSYATAGIHLVSVIIRHVTGSELEVFVRDRIAKPLGWGRWSFAYQNANLEHTPGGGGIAPRATDMLRFGYLLLHQGQWNGKQLVPAEYVRHCSRASVYNPHFPYSLQFDVNTGGNVAGVPRDAYWKSGSGGHAIYVVPSLDLVVWKMGGRSEQYSPQNTGLPASPSKNDLRAGWKASVAQTEATAGLLQRVVAAISR